MLDPDDMACLKEAKDGGGVLVTLDRVLITAGAITPYQAMDQALAEGGGNKEARAELSRLRSLTPAEMTEMAVQADKTYSLFRQHIQIDTRGARLIRRLRVEKDYSWRAVARCCSELWHGPWGGNQLAGLAICKKAANLMGEDFMKEPWN